VDANQSQLKINKNNNKRIINNNHPFSAPFSPRRKGWDGEKFRKDGK
jgi:hypothetical protein